jgi:hypothetical protein
MGENQTENHNTPMVAEIHAKQSSNEENSSLFMNSICGKAKNEGTSRNLRFEKSQDYAQKPQRNCTPTNSISVNTPYE